MKVPFSWLKDYVDIEICAQELQEKLLSCGFEVEELIYLGSEVDKVVTGKITSIKKHEDSDHLQICSVNCGSVYGQNIQIVTGADNIFEGAVVPVALDGASLPGGVKIKKGKLRGVVSEGMMCSGEELGINDDWYEGADVYGILILKEGTDVGVDIRKVVGLDDYIFDIGITANRPDCQSVLGIAREVAAILEKPVKEPSYDYKEHSEANDSDISVKVEAQDLCPRYIAHYVKDVKIDKSPAWIRKRLALCGLNSISNMVDITNFVLLELGQPMHAFDLSTLDGKSIDVRRAHNGEKITTLDEKEFKLDETNLVICDSKRPVALAGIMGGLNSEIKPETKDVVFESAKFARDSVRKTSRNLGQSSDSSAKFCKGVDEYTTGMAIKRALHLVEEFGCGTISATHFDVWANGKINRTVIKTTPDKINRVLGIEVKCDTICKILKNLEFEVEVNGNELTVTAPPYREDVFGYEDLAEEVIRMYGYDHIVPSYLYTAKVTNGGLNEKQRLELKLKNAVKMQGGFEIISYSFYSPADLDMLHLPDDAPERNAIKIANPISENYSIMCTSLVPNMINTIVKNYRRGNDGGRFFEVANVFNADELPLVKQPNENKTVCIGIYGDNETFFTLKGMVEGIADDFNIEFSYEKEEYYSKYFLHPNVSARIMCGGEQIGFMGQLAHTVCDELALQKPVFVAQIDYTLLSKHFNKSFRYTPIPEFPVVKRDFAFVCDEKITCGEIENVIKSSCKYVTDVKLFDIFRGKQIGQNKKSMAFNVTFTPQHKELSAKETDKFTAAILKQLEQKLGITLR